MKPAQEILNALPTFTGTESYYRVAPNGVLTDGTRYLSEAAGCYWLFEDTAVYLAGYEGVDHFAVIRIHVDKDLSFIVELGDGNGAWRPLFHGEYTDFPFTDFEFFAGYQPEVNSWVLLLKSEY